MCRRDGYTVTVTDQLGCTATASAIVDDPFPVELFVEGPAPICIGQEAIFTASASGGTSPFSCIWNEGTVNDSLAVTLDTTTTFSVVVTDANGCSTAPQELEVVVYPPLQLSVADLPIICGGDSSLLSAGPLHGIPYGVKDLLDTAGIPTTYGAEPFRNRGPPRIRPS